MTAAAIHRRPDRAASVVMRTTAARRDRLKAIAAEHGLTLQQWLEWKLLDLDQAPEAREGGRPRKDTPFPEMEESA